MCEFVQSHIRQAGFRVVPETGHYCDIILNLTLQKYIYERKLGPDIEI